jgi:hypothetical protein
MTSRRALRGILPAAAALFLTAAWLPSARADDHKDYREAKPEDCRDCHLGSNVAPNHGAGFLRDHRLLAQKTPNNCADCHEQSFCLDCHNGGNLSQDPRSSLSRRGESMPRTHAADFISTHPILAREEPRSCYRCHDSAKFCTDCHTRRSQQAGAPFDVRPHAPVYVSPGVLSPSWVAFHSGEARRNLQSCQSCHPQKSDCSNFACHPGLGGR